MFIGGRGIVMDNGSHFAKFGDFKFQPFFLFNRADRQTDKITDGNTDADDGLLMRLLSS